MYKFDCCQQSTNRHASTCFVTVQTLRYKQIYGKKHNNCFGIPEKLGWPSGQTSTNTVRFCCVSINIVPAYVCKGKMMSSTNSSMKACMSVCVYVFMHAHACNLLGIWNYIVGIKHKRKSSGTLGIQVTCSANKATRNRWQNVEKARSLALIKDHTCKLHTGHLSKL